MQFAYDAGMITKDALLKAQKQYIPCKGIQHYTIACKTLTHALT